MAVLVFGSLNVDLVVRAPELPVPGQTVLGDAFAQGAGGKGANQAVAAARLGSKVRMFGRVGDDPFGRMLLEELRRADVETAGVRIDETAHTGTALIVVAPDGENQIAVAPGANAHVEAEDARGLQIFMDSDSVLLLQLEVPIDASMAAARAARLAGARVVLDPAPAPDEPPAELLRAATVLTPNESEASRLSGVMVESIEGAIQAGRVLRRRYGTAVVVTVGDKGAVVVDERGITPVPPWPVDAVDAVGAGDAFNGALADGLARGLSLVDAARRAAAAGALATTVRGALPSMPTREALDAFIASRTTAP
ncbi:MAG: ribokinase [Acidobacteria bacterium]|nr:MAG: ribokinase [Acidobacteriota bacterium]